MKVNTELEMDIQMVNVSDIGAGLQGYLPDGTRYEDLVRVFGQPQMGKSIDNKIKAKWIGKINGLLFTVYDYKSGLEPTRNTDWHIGAKHKVTAHLLCAYWREMMRK